MKADHEIPYALFYENPTTYTGAADIYINVPLDAQHSASRAFWMFRTRDNLQRNRRYLTSSSDGNPYYRNVNLLIAGRDRESPAAPIIWNTLVPFSKEEKNPGFQLGEMNWDLSATAGRDSPWKRVPEGTINFSTAEKPAFLFFMRSPSTNDLFTSKTLELMVVIESWALYTIEKGRAYFAFSN